MDNKAPFKVCLNPIDLFTDVCLWIDLDRACGFEIFLKDLCQCFPQRQNNFFHKSLSYFYIVYDNIETTFFKNITCII